MANRTIRRSVDKIDEEIKRLQAQKIAVKKQERQKEQVYRKHALVVAGVLVEQCFGGWEKIDFELLDSWLKQNKDELLEQCQSRNSNSKINSKDVFSRLRTWEQEELEQDLYRSICRVDSPPRTKKSKVKKGIENKIMEEVSKVDGQEYRD